MSDGGRESERESKRKGQIWGFDVQDGASFLECKCQVSNRERPGRKSNPVCV